ncbi:hypothetical protein, partial [Streptococcus suis]|uniref:hypothetical protein n=1 Tax=Streptococcus suis TaxID=1307 RepID=UPI001EDCF518
LPTICKRTSYDLPDRFYHNHSGKKITLYYSLVWPVFTLLLSGTYLHPDNYYSFHKEIFYRFFYTSAAAHKFWITSYHQFPSLDDCQKNSYTG